MVHQASTGRHSHAVVSCTSCFVLVLCLVINASATSGRDDFQHDTGEGRRDDFQHDTGEGRRDDFKHDVEVGEDESGEKFQLHSRGQLVDLVDLDQVPEVKHVACSGSHLLLSMTSASVARRWTQGQLVVGGPHWACNASHSAEIGVQIYVKIARVVISVEGRREFSDHDMVTIHHVPAGPFDMLKEADIFFHYEPGKLTSQTHRKDGDKHNGHSQQGEGSRGRFRRDLYNVIANIINDINWKGNFSTVIPGPGTSDITSSEQVLLAVHRTWGQDRLNVTRGMGASLVQDDFVLLLSNLTGENRVAYTFDLVIKNVKGTPQIVRYISQFEVETDLNVDGTVSFSREMGVSSTTSLWVSPVSELLRVPVATSVDHPPVFLVVTGQSLVSASVQAYSAGASQLRSAYSGNGFVTLSQRHDPARLTGSDVTSREWSVTPMNQSLASRHRTKVKYSLQQTLKFNSAISWHFRDMAVEVSPPVELTVQPVVSLLSSKGPVSQCVHSTVSVEAQVFMAAARLKVSGFGIQFWDVLLQPSMSKDVALTEARLGEWCCARCQGPQQVAADSVTPSVAVVSRDDPSFLRLRVMRGHLVQFVDSGQGASWCGRVGRPCYSCSEASLDTQSSDVCAARLMTPRLVAALSHLATLVNTEWPHRQLLVLEGWDEPNSKTPTGLHAEDSVYRSGQGASVGLTTQQTPPPLSPAPLPLDSPSLLRLGQLAVCAGLGHVQLNSSDHSLHVAVEDDGFHASLTTLGQEEMDTREQFWDTVENLDVKDLYTLCGSAPYMPAGSRWPDTVLSAQHVCGPPEYLYRASRRDMDRLVQYRHDDSSLRFDPEGSGAVWCGEVSRPCDALCHVSPTMEAWDWCGSRMMSPRAALRLRTLQKLAEREGLNITVLAAFSEAMQNKSSSPPTLFNSGRAIRLATDPPGNESSLASLAVCAGFGFVQHTVDGLLEAYVISQFGYASQSVEFLEGSTHIIASHVLFDDEEYAIPGDLPYQHTDLPALVDGGFNSDVQLSEHVRVGDIVSRDSRFFRMDEVLLLCLEHVIEDFPLNVEIVKGSGYRTRSENFLHNVDVSHQEEVWGHQIGRAIEIRPAPVSNSTSLYLLAKSVLRQCSQLTQSRLQVLGLGCHSDHLYIDVRPQTKGRELEYVRVWDAGTLYCEDVLELQISMITGGPVIESERSQTCRGEGLDEGLEFLSFQMNQADLCDPGTHSDFCSASKAAREATAEKLQELLTLAAGHGRLPRFQILPDIRACLVDLCGGCMGSGPIFDEKVRKCSHLVHKYLESASAPYPELSNVTTFFNTDTDESSVQGEACRAGSVCVEHTPIYSLLATAVTARFYPDSASSVERELFEATVNPTPLLDLAAQELAFRATGVVTVYIERDSDILALRNVLKVLLVFNRNVSVVNIQVAPGANLDLVRASLQRKVTTWAITTCPDHSRFAIAPFYIAPMVSHRHKRSAELSEARNLVKSQLYDWEKTWLAKMF